MSATNGNAEICRKYRAQYGPEMPTAKLARIIFKENPLSFKSVEHARYSLRYIEGKIGLSNKEKVKDSMFFTEESRPINPYKLPESDEKEWTPYNLEGYKMALILSDVHLPYHSIEALTAAIKYAKERNPDVIILNGDTLDCHRLSRWVKEPDKRNFAEELKIFENFFQVLRAQFPKADIVFKFGNHEERYQHFLYEKASELAGVEEFMLENIIHKRAGGVVVVKDKRIIKACGLNILHGHEFGGSIFSPVNIARGLFLRGKVSAIQSHSHQTSEHSESDMNGRLTTTWSTGCLSELHPAYLPINKWNHGFAMVEMDGEEFEVQNKRIYHGKIL
jgi:predicted phosphodiesterase